MPDSSSLITDPFGPTLAPRPGELPRDKSSTREDLGSPGFPRAVRPRSSLISDPMDIERLNDAARRAPATPPDRAAQILQLERQTGLPAELIDRNLETVAQQAAAQDFNPDRFRAESPLLAQWLTAHPQHLAVAQDDLRALTSMETTLRFGKNLVGAVKAGAYGLSSGGIGALQGLAEYAIRSGQVQYDAEYGAPAGEAPSGPTRPFRPGEFGMRPDGTPKGTGFLGVLQRSDGGVMTEYSIADSENPKLRGPKGEYLDYPTLVPTLTREEVRTVLGLKEGQPVPESIKQKAEAHALARIDAGKSPFAQPGEQQALYPDIARARGVPSEAIADQPHAILTLHLIRQHLDEAATRARGTRGTGLIERGVLGGIESVTQMAALAPLSVLTGSTVPMLVGMGAQAFGSSYGQTRDAGKSIATAAGRGAFDGIVEVATEFTPAKWFLGDLAKNAPFRTLLLHQLKEEVFGEEIATALQDLSEWAVMHPEASFTDYLAARPSAAAETLITTIVASSLQSGGAHLLRVAAGAQAPRVLTELGAAARDSKTLQRDPASVEQFVRTATEGGPLESIGLPIDTFTQYWQSKGIDPATVARRLTGDPEAFAHAQETGADLQVPAGRYATQIAATEHNTFFANEARLAPDALNVREQAALEQAVQTQATQAEHQVATDTGAVSAAPVGESVVALLHRAGVEPGTARTYGALYEHAFGSLATRAGLDPVQLFERYGLQVQREGLTTPPTATAESAPATELAQGPPPENVDPFRAHIQREASTLGLRLTAEMVRRERATAPPLTDRARRVEYERQAIEQGHPFVVYDENGTRREISEKEEFGYQPAVGETLGVETPAGFRVLADNGGKPPTRLYQEDDEVIRRAAIQFGVDRQFRIDLLKRADLSSFLHESAHFYLEVLGDVVTELNTRDAATLTDTQQQMQTDYRELLAWLGVETRGEIGTAQHEQFARGFEAYLLEGNAPSPALRSVFARVRAWLTSIYRSATRLNVTLTDDVRNVMDRILATDDAIRAAQEDAGATPLFTDAVAKAAGFSAEDIAAYRRTVQSATDEARDRVQAKLLQQLQREREASWRRERAAIRDDVLADYVQRPEYRALAMLQRGTNADGTLLPEGVTPFKLSKAALVEQFGEDVLKRLPKPHVYARTGGVPPVVAADLLGFRSAQGLVNALLTTPPLAEAVDAEADRQMRERHGDLLLDGTLIDHARQAVLDSGAEVFAAEARALERLVTRRPRTSPPTPPIATLRELAARRVADLKLRDIRPASYAAAARRAGQRAIEAAAEQNFARALEAKQQQIISAEMYRAATEAVETVDAAQDRFKSMFGRDASLAQRYNMDLVFAARALLAQFELGPKTQGQTALQYLEQLRQVDPEIYADVDVAIAAAALPAQPYRDLTPDQFVTLRDSVFNLWHTARRSKQIIVEGRARELTEVRGELENRLRALTTRTNRQGYNRALTSWQQTKVYLLGWRAALRRMESWTDAMDGGKPGLFRRMFFTPITEAAAAYREAKKSYLERYLAIVKTVESSLTAEDIAAPELNYVFTGKMELLHALLHTGNQSNLRKLLLGDHEQRPRWGDLTPNGMLDTSRWDGFLRRLQRDGTLTRADYDYVQAVWDLTDELKPEAQKVHHDLFGYYFSEITAQPVSTPWGTYSGGYFPVQYDPFLAADVQRRSDKEVLEQTPTSFMFPTTGRGFTISRVEQYARPIALNLRVVPGHLDKVLRFIHLEPVVKDTARLATNKQFDRALSAFDPTVAGELVIPFLQRSARQTVDTPAQGWGGRGADRFFREIRRRTSMQIMTANVLNTLQQITGLSVAALKVPPRYLSRAVWRYVRGPKVLTDLITEKSAFMRTRTTTQTIEVQQTIDDLLLNPNTYDKARAFASKHGFFLQQGAQNAVDLVTWSGKYDHAISDGASEPDAVRQADAAVRATQGSFNPEDISAFEAGSPFMRAFTMFYSYWNMLANTLGSEFQIVARDMGLRRGAGRLFFVYAFGFMIPALLSDAIVKAGSGDNWDEDDDGVLDDLIVWFFGAQQRAATAMLPGVGTAINYGINAFNDKWYDDRISVSPIISTLESAGRAPYAAYKSLTEGKVTKREVRDVLTLVGMVSGLPAGAAAKPLGYLTDVSQGNAEPENPVDLARGLVSGR